MKKVFQTIVDEKDGDCSRAVIASLLDLDIIQVPHYNLFGNPQWFHVMFYFLYALGWYYEGCINPPVDKVFDRLDDYGIGGYHYAGVPSRTFAGRSSHAVVIDRQGNVVHDPNPNQLWADVNIFEKPDVQSVYLIRKRKDKEPPDQRLG